MRDLNNLLKSQSSEMQSGRSNPSNVILKLGLLTITPKNVKVRGLEYKNVDSVQCKYAKSESLNKRRKELLEPDRPISQFQLYLLLALCPRKVILTSLRLNYFI